MRKTKLSSDQEAAQELLKVARLLSGSDYEQDDYRIAIAKVFKKGIDRMGRVNVKRRRGYPTQVSGWALKGDDSQLDFRLSVADDGRNGIARIVFINAPGGVEVPLSGSPDSVAFDLWGEFSSHLMKVAKILVSDVTPSVGGESHELLIEHNKALSKELQRLKRDLGAERIQLNYKGKGGQAHRRQVYVKFKNGAVIDMFLESDHISLGGVVWIDPNGHRIKPNPSKIKYRHSVAATYDAVYDSLVSWMDVEPVVLGSEFSNKSELEKYLKEHPKADKSKHTVRENGGGGGGSSEKKPGFLTRVKDKAKEIGKNVKKNMDTKRSVSRVKHNVTNKVMKMVDEGKSLDKGNASLDGWGSTLKVEDRSAENALDWKKYTVDMENMDNNNDFVKEALKSFGLFDSVQDAAKEIQKIRSASSNRDALELVSVAKLLV